MSYLPSQSDMVYHNLLRVQTKTAADPTVTLNDMANGMIGLDVVASGADLTWTLDTPPAQYDGLGVVFQRMNSGAGLGAVILATAGAEHIDDADTMTLPNNKQAAKLRWNNAAANWEVIART